VSVLKEERHVQNRNQARPPPHLGPPQARIALAELWEILPLENRRRALFILGGAVGRQLIPETIGGAAPPSRSGATSRAGVPGKGAGHDNC